MARGLRRGRRHELPGLLRAREGFGLCPRRRGGRAAAARGAAHGRGGPVRRADALRVGGPFAAVLAAYATRPHRSDWRAAFAELRKAAESGARPVAAGHGAEKLARYYLRMRPIVVPTERRPDGTDRLKGKLPPGWIAIVGRPEARSAILAALGRRTILRELPRRVPEDRLFLEIR